MRRAGTVGRSRLALLAAMLLGYVLGWRLPDLWPELEEETGYPRSWAAGTVEAPLWRLEAIARGRLPRADLGGVAADLERTLDGLVGSLRETRPARRRLEVPDETSAETAALVAAYRRVYPTFRPGAGEVDQILAAAGEPAPALLRRAGPALGPALAAALTAEREASAALWAALQGRAEPPPLAVPRRADRLVLRIDEAGIAGRVRIYGDGRLVTTAPGPDAAETVRRLGRAAAADLAAALVAGGFLAPDRYEEWLERGAAGCRWLGATRRLMSLSRQPSQTVVTLSLERVGPLPGSTGPVLDRVERRLWVERGLLAEDCRPEDPVVRRLRSALLALRSLAGEPSRGPARVSPPPRAGRGVRLPPGGPALLYEDLRGVQRVTDGRLCGTLQGTVPRQGDAVSPGGGLVIRRGGKLVVIESPWGTRTRRISPPDWLAESAFWSPGGDALLLAGAPLAGRPRMLLADRRGRRPVPLAEEGAWPVGWSAGGRGVYYRRDAGRGRARFVDRAGVVLEVELPGDPKWIDGPALSPGGRHLAYRATHLVAGQPAAGIFTVELDPATGLPRPGARAVKVAETGRSFAWSPGGESLVYSMLREIREVGADGRNDRRLAGSEFGECDHGWPRVSPDGRWLAYLRCTYSSGEAGYLHLARRDGSGARRIGRGGWPRWLPAGTPRPALEEPCPN